MEKIAKRYKHLILKFDGLSQLNKIIDLGGKAGRDAAKDKNNLASINSCGKPMKNKNKKNKAWSPLLPGSFENGKRR